ncbi:MAG: N-acetyltransferase family protein [Thiobacillus sp.]
MKVNIRKATERDYQSVMEIYEQSTKLHSDLEPGWIKQDRPFGIKKEDYLKVINDSNDSTMLVAVSDDTVVGFAELSIKYEPENDYFSEKKFVWVNDIAVSEGMKKQGIGTRLLNAAENWAIEQGVHEVELATRFANKGAIDFYDKMGYQIYVVRSKKKIA